MTCFRASPLRDVKIGSSSGLIASVVPDQHHGIQVAFMRAGDYINLNMKDPLLAIPDVTISGRSELA